MEDPHLPVEHLLDILLNQLPLGLLLHGQQIRQGQLLPPLADRLEEDLGLAFEAAAASVGDAHDCDLLVGGVEEGSAARGLFGLVEEQAGDDGFVGPEVAAVRFLD